MAPPNEKDDVSFKEMVVFNEEYLKSLVQEELNDEPYYSDDSEVWPEEKEEKFENWYNEFHKQPIDIFAIPFGVGIGSWLRLMDIFDIRIISDVGSCHKMSVHGTITIRAGNVKDYIFARTRENPELIQPGDSLTLTGPNLVTQGYDTVTIELDLRNGRRELCQEFLVTNFIIFERYQTCRNTLLTDKLQGENGFSAEVTYAIYEFALVVSVEIKIFPKVKESDDPIKVFGTVEVSNSGLHGFTSTHNKTKTIMLFKRKKRNCVSLKGNGGVLPLSRSLLACPMPDDAMKLHLNLHSTKMVRVASTYVIFKPECFGEKEVVLESKYGSISVLFTVFHPDFHPPSVTALKNDSYRYTWPKEYR